MFLRCDVSPAARKLLSCIATAVLVTCVHFIGVVALQLQISLESGPPDAAIDRRIESLGNASLRLRRDVIVLRNALARGDAAAAAQRYRGLMPRLRRGEVLEAAELHALGAQALARTGDEAAAALARERATAARATLATHLPASLRTAQGAGNG